MPTYKHQFKGVLLWRLVLKHQRSDPRQRRQPEIEETLTGKDGAETLIHVVCDEEYAG